MTKRKPMTVAQIEARIAKIAAGLWDNESAHSDEDELRDDVLRAIAEGAPDPAALAAAVRKTNDLDYARWYA